MAINVLALLPVVLQILSAIPGLVTRAEHAFGPGTGAEKRKFVTDAVGYALDAATSVAKIKELTPDTKAAVVAAAGSLTDAVVDTYNAVGVFRKARSHPDLDTSGGR